MNISADLEGTFPQHYVNPSEISKRYYDFFPDDRDILILAQTFSVAIGSAGLFTHVRNTVEGIGMDIFDESREYGSSSGRLNGIITIQRGYAFPWLLTHEMLHRWVVSPDLSLDLAQQSGHWDTIQRNSSGFGEGTPGNGVFSKLEHFSENTYTASGEDVAAYYSDLELYFMGLIPLSDVETPIMTLIHPQNPQFNQITQTYIYQADGIRAVEVNEIVDVHGPRNPNQLESQKHFTTAMIVIYDRLLTDTELAYYDFLIREYEKAFTENLGGMSDGLTFEAATAGRATLESRLSEPITSIPENNKISKDFSLSQNYPNPFNPETTIEYQLDRPAFVKLTIYNLLGQPVRILVDEWQNSGKHKVVWDGLGEDHKTEAASSLYLYELKVGGKLIRKKMTLLR